MIVLLGCVFVTEVDRAAREGSGVGDSSAPPDSDTATGDSAATDTAKPDSGGDDSAEPTPTDRPTSLAIPAGSFWMGASILRDTSEYGHDQDSRRVTITRSFWIDATEVTELELRGGSEIPAIEVTWSEAAALANQRSDEDGLAPCYTCTGESCTPAGDGQDCEGWRLPTEAEWEYAARAGEDREFLGGDLLDSDANLGACDEDVALEDGRISGWTWYCVNSGSELPVRMPSSANRWGGYNFTGSAWEWVEDGYSPEKPADDVDPLVTDASDGRVIRGGDFRNPPVYVRLASRYAHAADAIDQGDEVGFRLVRTCPGGECN